MTFRLASPATVALAAAAVLAFPAASPAQDSAAAGTAPPTVTTEAPATGTTTTEAPPTDAATPAPVVPPAAASGAPTPPALTPPTPTAPGPLVLSVEQNETPIDGWNGWLVWSRRDLTGRFELIARTPAGAGVTLPVPSQDVPIDASIGPGPDGGPLIVYSRCVSSVEASPVGCDIYRIDPRTGAGGVVPSASRPDLNERHPTVWGNQIAFSREVVPGRRERYGIATVRLDGAAPKKASLFGPRRARRGKRTVPIVAYGPSDIDLRGSTLAYTWHTTGPGDRWQLIVNQRKKNVGRVARTVLTTTTTRKTIAALGRPALSASNLVVPVLRTGGDSRSEVLRMTYSGGRKAALQNGFTAAQTERYGSALTAVARPSDNVLVVLRRLASDGRWSCKHPALPNARGCEILQLSGAAQTWLPVARR